MKFTIDCFADEEELNWVEYTFLLTATPEQFIVRLAEYTEYIRSSIYAPVKQTKRGFWRYPDLRHESTRGQPEVPWYIRSKIMAHISTLVHVEGD